MTKSSTNGVSSHWPHEKRVITARFRELMRSQWATPKELEARQHELLMTLQKHYVNTSPWFFDRMKNLENLFPLASFVDLKRIPLMRRKDVDLAGERLYSLNSPLSHGPIYVSQTSGTTGEPVSIRRTNQNTLEWMALALREQAWRKPELTQQYCGIKSGCTEKRLMDNWGTPTRYVACSGQSLFLPVSLNISQLASEVEAFQPAYLQAYPNVITELARIYRIAGISLASVKGVYSFGETLTDDARQEIEDYFNVAVYDTYASQEFGIIASQCPECTNYHVMAENLIVEILDDNNFECTAGEVGRVVITDLKNFATPLIRYETGDYAERAAICNCGRGLPAIKRVVGRSRHMLRTPSGEIFWPKWGSIFRQLKLTAPFTQYQVRQIQIDKLEIRLCMSEALTAAAEDLLSDIIFNYFGFRFSLEIRCDSARIKCAASGKYSDFESLLHD